MTRLPEGAKPSHVVTGSVRKGASMSRVASIMEQLD